MLVIFILYLTYSLQWMSCNSIRFPEGRTERKHEDNSPISQFGNANFLTGFNNTRRSFEKGQHGREIVEITSADPTTASTLIVPNYPIDCVNERECELVASVGGIETTPMPTFKPYTQEKLNVYLKNYVNNNGKMPDIVIPGEQQSTNKLANLYMDEPVNVLEGTGKDEGKSQTSKSWQLMQAQTHKHPYDDRTGWVSLEPVPWSASQVQKWEPNTRPQHLPDWAQSNDQQPQASWNKPTNWQERPWNNKKPTYEYKPSPKPSTHWNDYSTSNHWNSGNPDIITDSGPSHFPHTEPTKRPPSSWYDRPQTGYNNDREDENHHYHNQHHPSTHPSEGDGRWVLLSSTKGYSMPHRNRAFQRALFINTKTPPDQLGPSVKSHRSVRLTVLPALNGTTNTTTSHGGLLEVEKTFLTVDEAQREHAAKMLRLDSINQGKASQPKELKRSAATTLKIYPVKATNLQANSNAMLAAVGAGMIPATMAMLVPMVLGRKRRSLPKQDHSAYYYNPNSKFAFIK